MIEKKKRERKAKDKQDEQKHNMKFKLSKREVAELLRNKGINPTSQRIEIAHFIYQKPQHVSAEEILNHLNKDYEKVSQATVYNTLKLFVEKNVVRELIFSSDRIYYDSNTTKHHHFLDLETGKIYDIPACLLSLPELDKNVLGNIEVEEINILIKGKFKIKK
ncbi:MAG: transcriptional repressor [Leptospiraceae bacterium]|nr:transcriptional repressor [Leptospiraceae bacterium]MDW7975243.1 transcriptional repressor [Leptospiraceae bacterium]